MEIKQAAVPIIPSNDLDATQAFYERLGFGLTSNYAAHGYRILHNGAGASVHLTRTEAGWIPSAMPMASIFTRRTSMSWPRNSAAGRRPARGACANLACLIRMERWSGSGGPISKIGCGRA